MSKRMEFRRIAVLLSVFAGAARVAVLPTLAQENDPLVMVVSPSNPVASVSKADARRMVLGQTVAWGDGKKVVVVLPQAANADRATVLQQICGMNEAEYRRFEMQIAFTGREPAKLQEEPSDAAVKAFVKANPGAIGFLHQAAIGKELKAVLTL